MTLSFRYCEAQLGKGQARISKGWPLRRKASMLEPLPRAYGTISQKMYKCLPPSPVWKDNRQPPQSATENFPLLV